MDFSQFFSDLLSNFLNSSFCIYISGLLNFIFTNLRKAIPFSDEWWDRNFSLVNLIFLLIISLVLNFIVEICSTLDKTSIDISEKTEKNSKESKLVFIYKNNKSLSSFVSFLQVIINYYISLSIIDIEIFKFDGLNKSLTSFANLVMSLLIAFFTDIFPKNFSIKYKKKFLDSYAFVSISFILTKIPLFIFPISSNAYKISDHQKENPTIFVNNLFADGQITGDVKETVNLAFQLEVKKVSSILTKKIISFEYSMNSDEVFALHIQHHHDLYPVFEDDKFIGYINMRKFSIIYENKKREENVILDWREEIMNADIFIRGKDLSISDVNEKMRKLDTGVLFIIKKNKNTDIKNLKKSDFIGVVTTGDISNFLNPRRRNDKKKNEKI